MRFVVPKLTLPESTPIQKASLAILALHSKPEFQHNVMLGGPTPPAMRAENERKDKEFQKQRLAIIAKYGVVEEYPAPLLEKEKKLAEKLECVRQEIDELEALRSYPK